MITNEEAVNIFNGFFEQIIKPYRHKADNIYKDKGNGEYGYHINRYFGHVFSYMLEHNLNSIVDLGAGVGHGIEILKIFGYKVKGFENEDQLIQENANIFGKKVGMNKFGSVTIEKKDLRNLNKSDIEGFEIIYMWQPFKDKELLNSFLSKVINMIDSNQTILFRKSNQKYYDGDNPFYLQQFTDKEIKMHETLEVLKK